MGMFTSVYDRNGKEVQIYTGEDRCDAYHIGDHVRWRIWPHDYGIRVLLDGVYKGWAEGEAHPYVLIKDHKILDVIPESELLIYANSSINIESLLANKYRIPELTQEQFEALFTPEAVIAHRQATLISLQAHLEYQASISHLSPSDQLRDAISQLVSIPVNYTAIGKILLDNEHQ